MKEDWLRLLGVGIAGLAVGAVAGHPFPGLALALLGWCGYRETAWRRLLAWLRDPQAPEKLFDSPGTHNEICRGIGTLRARAARRQRRLSATLRRFRTAVGAVPDAAVILDREGRISWANAAARNYLGVRWPEDRALYLSHLLRDPRFVSRLRASLAGSQEESLEIVSPVTKTMPLELRLLSQRQGNVFLMARDLSRQRELERVRREFVADASHELRTPLTVLQGYMELLREDAKEYPRLQPHLEQMQQQTTRLGTLVKDMLILSSLEAADRDNAPETTVDLSAELAGWCRDLEFLGAQRREKIGLEIEPGLGLRGRPGELHSLCSNLLRNAIQHTPPDGRITLRWYEDEQAAYLEVSDTGTGIAEEHVPRLTERFYRVHPGRDRRSGGTGLGLAIAHHVLLRHDAHLQIDSVLGQGSRFRCVFPPERIVRRAVTAQAADRIGEASRADT